MLELHMVDIHGAASCFFLDVPFGNSHQLKLNEHAQLAPQKDSGTPFLQRMLLVKGTTKFNICY
jgi:hypothetical protein